MPGSGNRSVDGGPWGWRRTLCRASITPRKERNTRERHGPRTQVHNACLNRGFNKNTRQHLLPPLPHLRHPIKCQIKLRVEYRSESCERQILCSLHKGKTLSQAERAKAKEGASSKPSPALAWAHRNPAVRALQEERGAHLQTQPLFIPIFIVLCSMSNQLQ